MCVRGALIAAVMILSTRVLVLAECCQNCGCDCCCRKVCHLKCEMKKVTKEEYTCECEDFCVPCPSKIVGYECGCDDHQGLLGCLTCGKKPIFRPTGATIHTRKKLVKHKVTKEVPSYKWVVETLCAHCAQQGSSGKPGQPPTDAKPPAKTPKKPAKSSQPR